MKKIFTIIFLLSFSVSALSANVNDLDVGDRVYVQGFFSDDLVTIVRVKYSSGKVKVKNEDGIVEWVNASKIITKSESDGNDWGRMGVGAVIAVCMLNPDACKSDK